MKSAGHVGYDPAHFRELFAVEDRHFWFRARNDVIAGLAKRAVSGLPPGYRVLEVGCGNGNVLRFLRAACPDGVVVGMDLYQEGLAFARQRVNCPLVVGDVNHAPFGRGFQVVGAFDVLEHIPDDRGILAGLWQLLDDGGKLLLTVPAHDRLWSYFDTASGHCRRYEPRELRSKLEAAGFEVQFLSPYMTCIYPLVWLARRLRAGAVRRDAPPEEVLRDEVRIVPVVNGVLRWILGREAGWLRSGRRLPAGASLVAVAVKRA